MNLGSIEHTSLRNLHLQSEGFYHVDWIFFSRGIAIPSLESVNVSAQKEDPFLKLFFPDLVAK